MNINSEKTNQVTIYIYIYIYIYTNNLYINMFHIHVYM